MCFFLGAEEPQAGAAEVHESGHRRGLVVVLREAKSIDINTSVEFRDHVYICMCMHVGFVLFYSFAVPFVLFSNWCLTCLRVFFVCVVLFVVFSDRYDGFRRFFRSDSPD